MLRKTRIETFSNFTSEAKTSELNLTNRIQEEEERISDIEVKIEEMDTSVKENVKSKNKFRYKTFRK